MQKLAIKHDMVAIKIKIFRLDSIIKMQNKFYKKTKEKKNENLKKKKHHIVEEVKKSNQKYIILINQPFWIYY